MQVNRHAFTCVLILIVCIVLILGNNYFKSPLLQGLSTGSYQSFGLTLFNNRKRSAKVRLIDANYKTVREWDFSSIPNVKKFGIQYAALDALSNIYPIVQQVSLSKYSYTGIKQWRVDIPVHHDLYFDLENRIHSLSLIPQKIKISNNYYSLLKDEIVILNKEGQLIGRHDLSDVLLQYFLAVDNYSKLRSAIERSKMDLFHINSIQYLEKELPGFCQVGDYLLSIRNYNRIVVFNPQIKKVTWSSVGVDLEHQHQAKLLPNNNILVLDNGIHRKSSRVIEFSPLSKQIIWEYPKTPNHKFYTRTMGGVQRLNNGNTLITIGLEGKVIEVNSDLRDYLGIP